MYEGQWNNFEGEISRLKLDLADRLRWEGKGSFELPDCEVKSNWLRIPKEREKSSPFLNALDRDDLQRLTETYFEQVTKRNMVIIASVVDKRYLYSSTTHETLHSRAYEFLLERIQNYLRMHHQRHRALIVMDDTEKGLNQSIAMRHASFQRYGNRNMSIPNIVEYPFFTRSELSNGVQLADQLAYNVYRAFRDEDFSYPYFKRLIQSFYRGRDGLILHGLKVWPDESPLVHLARSAWEQTKENPSV